jgi:hypothetical protein
MITTKIWGPYGWKYFHFVALAYPLNPTEEDKINYYNFYIFFGKTLPCQNCINNYNEHLQKYPLTNNILSTKDTLLKWTIDIHNEVNKKLDKKIYNYDDAIALIKNNYNEPLVFSKPVIESFTSLESDKNKTKNNNNTLFLFMFLFIALIIIAILYKNY